MSHTKSKIYSPLGLVLLISIILMSTVPIQYVFATASVTLGTHTIALVDGYPINHTNGTQTWAYNVTSGGGCCGINSISHWILFWCHEPSIEWASHTYEYGLDGNTGYYGIKFNYEFEAGETLIFYFRLHSQFATGDAPVIIKAGNDPTFVGVIDGPVFTYTVDASISGSGHGSTYMVANATMDYPDLSKVSVTFRWWGPYNASSVPENCTTPADPTYREVTDTAAPYSDQIGPVDESQLGYWYVEFEFNVDGVEVTGEKSPNHERIYHDIISVTEVPWFTSLPVILLISISAIAWVKRKKTIRSPKFQLS